MSSMRRPYVVTFTLMAGAVGCHAASDAPADASTGSDGSAVDALDEVGDADAAAEVDLDAPDCPEARPVLGEHCSAPKDWRCPYADPCPQAPSGGGDDDFACVEHQWLAVGDAYVIECPTPPPEAGTECLCAAHLPSGCILQVCPDLVPMVFDVCDDSLRQWRIQEVPCNPPPPGDADVDGDADGDADADADDASD
jgi:hypothetical protein